MGEKSKISWTDATFNPWWGCTNISPGCDRCYAEGTSVRWGFDIWGKDAGRRFFGEKHWNEPLKWNDRARKSTSRLKVFCASMCDVLEEWVGTTPGGKNLMDMERTRLWELVEQTPSLDWLLLTKRPQNYKKMLPAEWLKNPLPNVWLLTTVELQEFDWRIHHLLKVPAVVHGVSYEPALGPVDFTHVKCIGSGYMNGLNGRYEGCDSAEDRIDWVISGGESGAGSRPFELWWAYSVLDQCRQNGTNFFMKQLGGHPDKRDDLAAWPLDLRVQEFPKAVLA